MIPRINIHIFLHSVNLFVLVKRKLNIFSEVGAPLVKLGVEPLDEKVRRQQSNWLRHVTRMNNRMPKIMLNYRPPGRRQLGRPLKRLLDEAETGLSRPNS
jgi:hypothetical protein